MFAFLEWLFRNELFSGFGLLGFFFFFAGSVGVC